jgi:hypothetical protein
MLPPPSYLGHSQDASQDVLNIYQHLCSDYYKEKIMMKALSLSFFKVRVTGAGEGFYS